MKHLLTSILIVLFYGRLLFKIDGSHFLQSVLNIVFVYKLTLGKQVFFLKNMNILYLFGFDPYKKVYKMCTQNAPFPIL